MDIITLRCPNLKCRRVLQVPADARGQKVRCSHCNSTFVVPQSRPKKQFVPAGAEDRPEPTK